ncbi:MAG TPA: hypothetical protein VK281_15720 [Xanthobacteraceae bacterium]|nr:hypothetical protein [Xanthobacteraceae bacterium]
MTIALLFTGHMTDLPGRAEPRFPDSLTDAARARIGAAIDRRVPDPRGPTDGLAALGFASAARGGDILFHEECRRRGIDTVIVLPFDPEEFVRRSVDGVPGTDWPGRFRDLWSTTPTGHRHVLGLPVNDEAFALCNARLLDLARQHGRVHLIALWDGKGGDGPGGTADLVSNIRAGDEPDIIAPRDLQS